MAERVQLYDDRNRPAGTATRARMRAENLRHGATAVLVRDGYGRLYLHRRTDTKDVYPGRYDFVAGGVLAAGEDPLAGAIRELAEELGITGVDLTELCRGHYADDHTDYQAFCYLTRWDGPVRWQPEEVAWGDWVTIDQLVDWLDTRADELMPDTVALLGGWVRQRAAARRRPATSGDCDTEILEDRWVDRRPREATVAPRLRGEARLLPLLAPLLPLPIPVPIVIQDDPLIVRHRLTLGAPPDRGDLTATTGEALGHFLRRLHDVAPELAADAGLPGADAAGLAHRERLGDLAHDVLPLLPDTLQARGRQLLTDLADAPTDTLVHADLTAGHVVTLAGRISAVIGWTRVGLGDPAMDLAWPCGDTPAAFAEAVARAYGGTREQLRRADRWRTLSPWHGIRRGLATGRPALVETSLTAAVAALGAG